MSRTYKDVPSRLVWENLPDDYLLREWVDIAHLSKAVRKKGKSLAKSLGRPNHPAMMRSFDGAYCRRRGCCRVEGSRARAKEKQRWTKEVLNA
jgi:hypothetical protein